LLRVVDDILDLSKIEAGRLELEQAPFHLPSLLHDMRVLFSERAREKGLKLTVSMPDSLNVMLMGDRHRLLQILTNLVSNALKFTAEGSITINLGQADDLGSALRLHFEVADTGIGIPAAKHEVIFEAFTQADSSMTRRFGGTGLGLSIARQLTHMMSGEIGVRSTVGEGSTFWFTVVLDKAADTRPRRPAATLRPPPTSASGNQTQAREMTAANREFQAALQATGRATLRVMLVEDNAANMRVTQALLETLGCDVVPAWNGLEAVALCRDDEFDLILMDCQMPEMDGYEATRAIRQLESFEGRTTPIIALTAHAMEGSREASLAAGMNDQLTKPLTLAMLTQKLVEWVKQTGQPQTSAINAP
jgi:CheY-like chemotaxis protein